MNLIFLNNFSYLAVNSIKAERTGCLPRRLNQKIVSTIIDRTRFLSFSHLIKNYCIFPQTAFWIPWWIYSSHPLSWRVVSLLYIHLYKKEKGRICRGKISSWCQQIQSCLKKLTVHTSCLGQGRGLWWEEWDSLWWTDRQGPQALLPGQGRAWAVVFLITSQPVILGLQKS